MESIVILLLIFSVASSIEKKEAKQHEINEQISELREALSYHKSVVNRSLKELEKMRNYTECVTKKRIYDYLFAIMPYYLKKHTQYFFENIKNELMLCSNDINKNNFKMPPIGEELFINEIESKIKKQVESYVNNTATNLNSTWIKLIQDTNRTMDEGKKDILEIKGEILSIKNDLEQQAEEIPLKPQLENISDSMRVLVEEVHLLKELPNVVHIKLSDQFNRTEEAVKSVADISNETEAIKNTLEDLREKTDIVLEESKQIKHEIEEMQETISEQKSNQSSVMKTMKQKVQNMFELLSSAQEEVRHLKTLDKDLKVNLSDLYNKTDEHRLLLKISQDEMDKMNEKLGNKIKHLQEEMKTTGRGTLSKPGEENSQPSRGRNVNDVYSDDSDPNVAATENTSIMAEAPCLNFKVSDPDVIMTIEESSEISNDMTLDNSAYRPSGEERIFRCKHIGRFQLKGDTRIRCENGQWSGSPPSCVKLPDETDMLDYLVGKHPCPAANDQFPHPTDCSKFYNCDSLLRGHEINCQKDLRFDFPSRRCEFDYLTNCQKSRLKASNFSDSPPAIDYSIDESGNEGTNTTYVNEEGSLVVYPGTKIVFSCLFPRAFGEPDWKVPDEGSSTWTRKWVGSSLPGTEMKYNIAVLISKKKDSGNFTCVIPNNGQMHTIKVVVPIIGCQRPDLSQHKGLQLNSNRNEYDVEEIVSFTCPKGYNVLGPSRMTCQSNGLWSKSPSRMPVCFPAD